MHLPMFVEFDTLIYCHIRLKEKENVTGGQSSRKMVLDWRCSILYSRNSYMNVVNIREAVIFVDGGILPGMNCGIIWKIHARFPRHPAKKKKSYIYFFFKGFTTPNKKERHHGTIKVRQQCASSQSWKKKREEFEFCSGEYGNQFFHFFLFKKVGLACPLLLLRHSKPINIHPVIVQCSQTNRRWINHQAD